MELALDVKRKDGVAFFSPYLKPPFTTLFVSTRAMCVDFILSTTLSHSPPERLSQAAGEFPLLFELRGGHLVPSHGETVTVAMGVQSPVGALSSQ